VKARLLDDLAEILDVLAVAERRAEAAETADLDKFVMFARDELVKAAHRLAGSRHRPDGMLGRRWVAGEVAVMGLVAFVCAYVAAVLFDLPPWLSVLVVIAGQAVLSFVAYQLIRHLDTRLLAGPVPGWPGTRPVPTHVAGQDFEVLLARTRSMIGHLAIQRLGRAPIPIRSGRQAQWVGQHDAFLRHLHHADCYLSGAQWRWTTHGRGVAA
jgi:hypothetical protein